jgi:hypothetical protein
VEPYILLIQPIERKLQGFNLILIVHHIILSLVFSDVRVSFADDAIAVRI